MSEAPADNFIKNAFKILDENSVSNTSETWYPLEKVPPVRKLASSRRNKKCDVEGCTLDACSLWSTWKRSENFESASMSLIYVCVDFQEGKFGGWPSLNFFWEKVM